MSLLLPQKLQTEFLHFLEHKLTDMESRLGALDQEKGALQAALSQKQKELQEANYALEELRKDTRSPSITSPSTEQEAFIDSLRSDLEKADEACHTERKHRMSAESSLSEMTKAMERLKVEHREHVREKEALDKEIIDLRQRLERAESACAEANTERDRSNAACFERESAEKRVQQKLIDTEKGLDTMTKDLSALRLRLSKHVKELEGGDISMLKLKLFEENMCSLPDPGSTPVKIGSLPPIETSELELNKRINKLNYNKVIHASIHGQNNMAWFQFSCHGVQVFPQSLFTSSNHGSKWQGFPVSERSGLGRKGVEVFHTYLEKTYYIGTYKVLQGPGGIRLSDLDSISLVRRGYSKMCNLGYDMSKMAAGSTPARNPVALGMPEMYQKGILTVQLLGLQRIGFNKEVDAEVHRATSKSSATQVLGCKKGEVSGGLNKAADTAVPQLGEMNDREGEGDTAEDDREGDGDDDDSGIKDEDEGGDGDDDVDGDDDEGEGDDGEDVSGYKPGVVQDSDTRKRPLEEVSKPSASPKTASKRAKVV